MQIKGEDFIKKVQLKQERDELERKLSELDDVEMTINDEPVILSRNINNNMNMNNSNDINNMNENDHELNNIMLGSSASSSNEENKKKYLILGIVLVVLFLLTIIIIRLLTGDSNKEDQFTSNNANSSEIKKLSENSSIEENFQKIINERVKKDSSQSVSSEAKTSVDERLESIQQTVEADFPRNETIQEEASESISNEDMDETIKRIEDKKIVQKEKEIEKKEVAKKEVVVKKTEPKKSVKDLVQSSSSEMTKGYFVQIGAFTKKPSDSYINSIRNEGFKYKVYQVEIKGTLYNKVLIGPYSTRGAANQDINDIKDKLKISNAFILKF